MELPNLNQVGVFHSGNRIIRQWFLQAGRILTNRAPIAQTAKQQLKIAYNEV